MLSILPENPLQQGDDLLVDVKVTTNAHENRVVGWQQGYLVVRLRAVPEKGKANAALVEIVAKEFSLSKSHVTIVAGTTSRIKRLRLHACKSDTIRKK